MILLTPRRDHCIPMNGDKGSRTPVRNIGGTTYPQKRKPPIGFEPMANGLQNRCSTTELKRQRVTI